MPLVCAACGTENADNARFCRRCGAALVAHMPGDGSAAHPVRTRVVAMIIGAVAGAAAAGSLSYMWFQEEKAKIEAEATREADRRYQAELRGVRKRLLDFEQAKIDAEQESSHSLAQQEAARRESEAARAELRAAATRAAREAIAKRQEAAEKARLEALERKRAEEFAAAAAAARAAAASQRPAPLPPPVAAPAVQTAQASPEALCRSMTNFISRGICETRECIKPQYQGSDYCRSLRARAAAQPQHP